MEDRFDTDVDDRGRRSRIQAGSETGWGKVEGDLTVRSEFRFRFLPLDRQAPAAWKRASQRVGLPVTMALGEPDEDGIEATLVTDGDQPIVVWEDRGMPLDQVAAYGAGVQIHVEDLAAYLAGRERREDVKARWDELQHAYQSLGSPTSPLQCLNTTLALGQGAVA